LLTTPYKLVPCTMQVPHRYKLCKKSRPLFDLQPSVIVALALKETSVQTEFQESNDRPQHNILHSGHLSAKIVYPVSRWFWLELLSPFSISCWLKYYSTFIAKEQAMHLVMTTSTLVNRVWCLVAVSAISYLLMWMWVPWPKKYEPGVRRHTTNFSLFQCSPLKVVLRSRSKLYNNVCRAGSSLSASLSFLVNGLLVLFLQLFQYRVLNVNLQYRHHTEKKCRGWPVCCSSKMPHFYSLFMSWLTIIILVQWSINQQ